MILKDGRLCCVIGTPFQLLTRNTKQKFTNIIKCFEGTVFAPPTLLKDLMGGGGGKNIAVTLGMQL